MKVRLAPLYFSEANKREHDQNEDLLKHTEEYYGNVTALPPVTLVGDPIPKCRTR